jgi:hypothetical protein
MLQRMMRSPVRSVLLVLGLAGALGACSAGAIVDRLPEGMGEPAAMPARPTSPYVYPAVHDMPPPRATPVMTEDQQVKLEKDLTTVRDRQETTAAKAATTGDTDTPPAATPDKKAKKKAAAPQKDKEQAANAKDGATTNP